MPDSQKQPAHTYRAAGVDLEAAERVKQHIAQAVATTRTPDSQGAIGAFGGMVRLPADVANPTLVMSTDGVGTKVLVARLARRYDTVGEDLVNHCVNDILVHGARPLAFLDYVAGSELEDATIAAIVDGVARGCRQHRMPLVGGETAQMPDLYRAGEFDLAGTIVGVVDGAQALHGDRIRPGDTLVGYASTGLHTNGYTLARQILFGTLGLGPDDPLPGQDRSVGDALLAVHRSYYAPLMPCMDRVHALAHITGGGIAGNLVRLLPDSCEAVVELAAWNPPPLFGILEREGRIPAQEMRAVFNLGVGMIAVVPASSVGPLRTVAAEKGIETWVIGDIRRGRKGVRFVD